MDTRDPGQAASQLTWVNVGVAFCFIILDAVISRAFQLRLEGSIITAAIRCIAQLALVALILRKVFEAYDPWAVAAIAGKFLYRGYHPVADSLLFYGQQFS